MAAQHNPLLNYPRDDLADMAQSAASVLDEIIPFLDFCEEVLLRYPKKEVQVRAVLGVVNMTQERLQAARDALS